MLSILINFGCHFGCSYCVYRDNKINIPFTHIDTFGWNQLEEELKKHIGEEVSISGGGDPLYNYNNKEVKMFYSKLFLLLNKYDCKLELHTSIFNPHFPYENCERVVFHFTMPNQIKMLYYRTSLVSLPDKVRVVFVVQEHYSEHFVQEIVKEVKESSSEITELSFRQMIKADGTIDYTLYDYLKEGHMKDWYYIEQQDYNEYFVQDHIEKEYLAIK